MRYAAAKALLGTTTRHRLFSCRIAQVSPRPPPPPPPSAKEKCQTANAFRQSPCSLLRSNQLPHLGVVQTLRFAIYSDSGMALGVRWTTAEGGQKQKKVTWDRGLAAVIFWILFHFQWSFPAFLDRWVPFGKREGTGTQNSGAILRLGFPEKKKIGLGHCI